jgi:hypothetical protein
MRILPSRLRNLIADGIMLYALPAAIALLPWTLGFRLLQRLARIESLHRLAVEPAWQAARQYLPDLDEREFKSRFRLLRLVDQVDTYLTLLRSTRWWERRIELQGEWPPATAGRVFLTFHWGAGHWIWRGMRAHGFGAYFLARRAEGRALGITRLSHWYGSFRAWAIVRIGSRGPWFTGGSRERLLEELRGGASVVGMLDLSAIPGQRTVEVPLLDRRVRFPCGLAELAVQTGVPITLFSAGLDPDSGRRQLRMENLPAGIAVPEVMARYAVHLQERLHDAPEFWQVWREAPGIFIEDTQVRPVQAL